MVGQKHKVDLHTKALAFLRKAQRPMSAYDVLAELRQFNPKIAPTTVYRALNALMERKKIHRLESMNAYICLLYTSPSPRDATLSRMPSSA